MSTTLVHLRRFVVTGSLAAAIGFFPEPDRWSRPFVPTCAPMHRAIGHVPGRLEPVWELRCELDEPFQQGAHRTVNDLPPTTAVRNEEP